MSDDKLTLAYQKRLLEQFGQLVGRRAEEEAAIGREYAQRDAQLVQQFQAQFEQLERDLEFEQAISEAKGALPRKSPIDEYEARWRGISQRVERARRKIRRRYRAGMKAARRNRDRVCQEATAELQAARSGIEEHFSSLCEVFTMKRTAIAEVAAAAEKLALQRGATPPDDIAVPADDEESNSSARRRFRLAMKQSRALLAEMETLAAAQLTKWPRLSAVAAMSAAVLAVATGLLLGWDRWMWIAGAALAGSAVITAFVYTSADPIAQRQTLSLFRQLRQSLYRAETALAESFAEAKGEYERHRASLVSEHQRKLRRVDAWRIRKAAALKAKMDRKTATNHEKAQARRRMLAQQRDRQLARPEDGGSVGLAERRPHPEIAAVKQLHEQQLAESKGQHESALSSVVAQWSTGLADLTADIDEINRDCQRWFPDWDSIDLAHWQPPAEAPPAVRFGEYRVATADFSSQLPDDASVALDEAEFSLPALLNFTEHTALILKTGDARRDQPLQAITATLLRVLLSRPRGNVQLTIVDPVGLASDLSAFARLNEFETSPVTVADQPEEALAELLRDGEAEASAALRVLVIVGFPAGISAAAVEQLQRILQGPTQGRFAVLLHVDRAAASDVDLEPLEAAGVTIEHVEGGFRFQDEQLARFPLTLDGPPAEGLLATALAALLQVPEQAAGAANSQSSMQLD